MELYLVKGRRIWEDIKFDEIVHGTFVMALAAPEARPLRLMRAGPFIPPFTLPLTTPVITESCRLKLISAGLGKFTFVPVLKEHIVDLAWELWDRKAAKPRGRFPPCISDYLESLPHSSEAAEKMEPLWEIDVDDTVHYESRQVVKNRGARYTYVDPATIPNDGMFGSKGIGLPIVTHAMKEFLAEVAGDWLEFSPVVFEHPKRQRFYISNRYLNLIGDVTRDSLKGYIEEMDIDADRHKVELINISEWCIASSKRGNVQIYMNTRGHEQYRLLTNVSRAKQLELMQHFYDGRVDLLLKEPWALERSMPTGQMQPGPGDIVIE